MKRLKWLTPILVLLASPPTLFALSRTSRVQLIGDMVRRVDTTEKVVALTFDDGPNNPYTEDILEILAEENAVATFFVVGENAKRNTELLTRMANEGHELGNHSWSHQRMVFKSTSWMRKEINDTDRAIRDSGYTGNIHFRSPYGKKLFVLPYVLWRQDRTNILFDVIPNPPDYRRPKPEALHDFVTTHTRPGSIILLHDGGGIRTETTKATRMIVQSLQAEGYTFVTVSELLERRR